ncbi:MAG: NAD/NADP transhydrogenase alpha subunit [Candidatus Pristimantibacillus lignocellulolyticus]|uniref:NAD/NADP transhydrogenase alpha subunit n=1 Tax=Candidatus Pristimantibacillus lignocellulolyticus TaxID=2994561 RepID=A0A9J6ZD02_9BACL|nr:MAG: NAD/NADP transhydrogenase alpha subunit [Candidatus Pristimantibacillus lignocellulolyticus]
MKCISVYTNSFEQFSDIYEQVLESPPQENEDILFDGITVSGSGHVPHQYIERMRVKPEVVVMREKARDIMILQHGNVFEICLPSDGEDEEVYEEEVVE